MPIRREDYLSAADLTKATREARERGPLPFSEEDFEFKLVGWLIDARKYGSDTALCEAVIRTPYEHTPATEAYIMGFLQGLEYSVRPTSSLRGSYFGLDLMITWPP
jgi:hypothetical protein